MAVQASVDRSWHDGTSFERFVFGLDQWLRHRQNIFEYAQDSACVFRIQPDVANLRCRLSDGTQIMPGRAVLWLHIWNEHIPRMGPNGPTLGWAIRFRRALDRSLESLAAHLLVRPELDEFCAICGNMVLGTPEQTGQLLHLAERLGFEQGLIERQKPSIGEQLHRRGENMLALLLVMAVNPTSARLAVLRRERTLVFMSRNRLLQLYGPGRRKARPAAR